MTGDSGLRDRMADFQPKVIGHVDVSGFAWPAPAPGPQAAFHPDEARDEHGRWGHSGGLLPDPPAAALKDSLHSWVSSYKISGKIQRDMTRLIKNPAAEGVSPDARNILGALQNRSIPGPALFRGMWWAPGDRKAGKFISKLQEGKTIDMPISSFTADESVSGPFAPSADGQERGASVLIKVEPGSQAYDISGQAGILKSQQEHITGGRYEVVSVGVNPIPQKTIEGYEAMGLTEGLARLRANADKNYLVVLRQVQGV